MRTAFMEMFGLSAPILQAPIGGCGTVELVAAVGRAGGLGSLAMTWTGRDEGMAKLAQLKTANVPFFFNFVLRFGTEKLPWYYDSSLPAVTLSWGIDAAIMAAFKRHGTRVGVQIASVEGALGALDAGADFIIVQGMEAGGHVQSSTPLARLLTEIIPLAGSVPVVAAGGISTAPDIARVIKAGAQAVMLGTRFVASAESAAHELYKKALVAAKPEDQSIHTASISTGPTPCTECYGTRRLRLGKPPETRSHRTGPAKAISWSAKAAKSLCAIVTRRPPRTPRVMYWRLASMLALAFMESPACDPRRILFNHSGQKHRTSCPEPFPIHANVAS
jgi:Nitronate monooxygenase